MGTYVYTRRKSTIEAVHATTGETLTLGTVHYAFKPYNDILNAALDYRHEKETSCYRTPTLPRYLNEWEKKVAVGYLRILGRADKVAGTPMVVDLPSTAEGRKLVMESVKNRGGKMMVYSMNPADSWSYDCPTIGTGQVGELVWDRRDGGRFLFIPISGGRS